MADPSDASTLLNDLNAEFPWLASLGLTPAWFQNTAATAASDADVVAQLRATPQYKNTFVGILRPDGSMRMSEADYLSTKHQFKQLITQYGHAATDSPADYKDFFESEVDPNELKQRLDVWQQVKNGGQDMKDNFFVYAGIKLDDNQLYDYFTDPEKASSMQTDYNQKVAAQPLDYQTWITRATEAGLARVSSQLTQLQQQGALSGQAVSAVTSTDPAFARQIMDALYHGGDPNNAQPLGLQDLLATFDEAAIGSAATQTGLNLPDKARIQELRAAGVTRASATQAYSQFAANQSTYAGDVQRLTQAGRSFTQSDFEDAALLGNGQQQDLLSRAQKQADSYGQAAGSFQVNQNKRGQFTQQGLTNQL